MLNLSSPIFVGPQRIDAIEVQIPPPDLLDDRPNGVHEAIWNLACYTGLPVEAVEQLTLVDAEAITGQVERVVSAFRARVREMRK